MRCSLLLPFLALGLLLLVGCTAGPGHTRAAGALGGTGAGALIGAAVGEASGGHAGTGAVLGGLLGYMAGTTAGEAIAEDQERARGPRVRRRPVRYRRVCRPRRVVVYEEVYEPCYGPPPPVIYEPGCR